MGMAEMGVALRMRAHAPQPGRPQVARIMRKKKAIQILKMQQLKLKDDSYSADKRWVIQTQDYIKYFFGENSPQYDYIRNTAFDYYKYTNESDKDIIERIQRTKIIYIRFLKIV